uniref:Uncharacterized protein n=1 Tax=Strombidinopsis acuminata TaxID=141414 RepID=A0A7S3S637_9SPIT|mmetsp:Transcript_2132/g.2631  ORF Transcript_2132/g.2631 Transcript_2132/m.2631 type:complete len:331 (+) Transcript_2132:143-1135(+)
MEAELAAVPGREFMPAALIDSEAEQEVDPAPPPPPPPVKPRRLTIQLIGKSSLDGDAAELASLGVDEYAERVLALNRLRLGHLQLGSMDGLDPCNAATHLYLQHNLITEIESLEFFSQLQFLVLSHNKLTEVSGISHLSSLLHLDLSHNQIEEIRQPVATFPSSLVHLSLAANPCAGRRGYRQEMIGALTGLKKLDDLTIQAWERGAIEEEDDRDDGDEESEIAESVPSVDSSGVRDRVEAAVNSATEHRQVTSSVDSAQELYERVAARSGVADMPNTMRSKLEEIRERSRRRRFEALQDTSIADAIALIGRERPRLNKGAGQGAKMHGT